MTLKSMDGRKRYLALLLACTFPISGCALVSDSEDARASLFSRWSKLLPSSIETSSESMPEGNPSSIEHERIANPPARTIRFDGHEIVLGDAESTAWSTEQLLGKIHPLIQQKKLHSASQAILQHLEVSERLLLERWATDSQSADIQFVAEVLNSRIPSTSSSNWKTLFQQTLVQSDASRVYQQHRNAFATTLQTSDPSNEEAMQLLDTAQKLAHPLVLTDCLRLLALRAMIAERWQEGESHYSQAIAIADGAELHALASELRLSYAECLKRSGRPTAAQAIWIAAVQQQLGLSKSEESIDVGFWLRAEHARPEGASWPIELASLMTKHTKRLGCSTGGPSEMHLWAAIAQAEFRRGDIQISLVHFKKAEVIAEGDDRMWLRIAQSKCLSALGQIPAATAILAGPAASSNDMLAATASAALGSTKIQSGAYQQGAQLLNKALTQHAGIDWPNKLESQADLALSQLIIGETNRGLESLHKVQNDFEKQKDWTSLIQSLENETRLLEHEGRTTEVISLKNRIAELESRLI